MPTESKRLQIIDHVHTTLRDKIRRKDGYWFDSFDESVTLTRKTLEQITAAKMPFVQIEADDESVDGLFSSPKRDRAVLDVLLFGVVKADPDFQQRDRERWLRDVMVALQIDTTRGGIAHATRPRDISIADGELGFKQHSSFRLRMEITFDFDWSTP